MPSCFFFPPLITWYFHCFLPWCSPFNAFHYVLKFSNDDAFEDLQHCIFQFYFIFFHDIISQLLLIIMLMPLYGFHVPLRLKALQIDWCEKEAWMFSCMFIKMMVLKYNGSSMDDDDVRMSAKLNGAFWALMIFLQCTTWWTKFMYYVHSWPCCCFHLTLFCLAFLKFLFLHAYLWVNCGQE
jgi:hypothetical protein